MQATTSDLDTLRQSTREFCERAIRPNARERDRSEHLPDELLQELRDVGMLALTVPTEHGGLGLGPLAYAVVMEELGAADQSVRATVSVSVSLVGLTLAAWGTDEQKRTWLPRLAQGELAAFGLTEPGAGSDPTSLATRARRDGADWVIDGTKMFITNGSRGALTLVFAQARDGDTQLGLTCFLVPQGTHGYSATPIHGKLGLRSSDTSEVVLQACRVPGSAILGEVGRGLRIALSGLDHGRFSLAAGSVGLAREALEVSCSHAAQRSQFGRPIGSFQLVQELLADTLIDVQAARGLVLAAAEAKHSGRDATIPISTAKVYASEAAVRCADRAIQVHGGYGYIDEYPVQRLLRDARIGTLYEGTTQIQKLILGRHLTGTSAFAN